MSELMEIPLKRRDTFYEVEPSKRDAKRQSAHRMNGNRLCCKSPEWFTVHDANLAFKQRIRDRGLSHHSSIKNQTSQHWPVAATGEIPNDQNLFLAHGSAFEQRT
ncbi:hypothetical protein [Pseudomonas viridiflava]